MITFIQNCVNELVRRHENEPDFVIIIPSKRAKKIILETLARSYGKPIFLPPVYTIEEFNSSWSSLPNIDKTRQLFMLFNIVTKLPRNETLTFEEFLTWGPMLVNDFEEMNRYLLTPDEVFKNLNSIKELESWNLDGDGTLSESQQRFMAFWNDLPVIHSSFLNELKELKKSTSALTLRNLAEQTHDIIEQTQHHYFIGFNALSLAELSVIKKLIHRNQATFWIDADAYYLSNALHEAGFFHRKNMGYLSIKKPDFVRNELESKKLLIDIIACAQVTGQVKIAATELSKKTSKDLNNTLVLLADESLIVPLMKNIPASVQKANITIGLPLRQTAIKSLIDVIFTIQENKIRFKSEAAYFKDLLLLLQHPMLAINLDPKTQGKISEWERSTIQLNKVFQKIDQLSFDPFVDELLSTAFDSWNGDYTKGINLFQEITELLIANTSAEFELELQQLGAFQEALVTLSVLAKEGIPPMNMRAFRLFFNQHWTKKSISFHGDPSDGLQIMGLLESRLLDFKHLIILGMNEGMLPANNIIESIIPMDLRRGLGLPTNRENQGLFAHHFYRLLHHAEDVIITYTTASEGIGSAEPSRYLSQIEMELARVNKHCQINKRFYNTVMQSQQGFDSTKINKGPQINLLLENYFSKSISASALNKYLTCPLDFYYRYLAEFGEEDEVEEELASSSIGKFIHNTLEKLYTPYVEIDKKGVPITPSPPPLSKDIIEAMRIQAPEVLKQELLCFLDQDIRLIQSGKNWVVYNVAKELLDNFLLNEIIYINTANEPVYIHRIEAKLTAELGVEIKGNKQRINWIGFVDRIDRIGADYRLIDYKTGNVSPEHVTFKHKADRLDSFKGCKHALQLAVYAFLFHENYGFYPKTIGIYALQKKQNAFFPLNIYDLSPHEFIEEFKILSEDVLNEIFDLNKPFIHSEEAKYCSYCQ